MDSCDELEDHLLNVIQKSVEQRITFKEIKGMDSARTKSGIQDQFVQEEKFVVLRERRGCQNRARAGEGDRSRKVKGYPAADMDHTREEDYAEGKENASPSESDQTLDRNCEMRSSVKSALKRLGTLYSDGNISSPIHRTEGDFSAEPVGNCDAASGDLAQLKPGASRPEARSARLAALANTINQWEDDLSHPVIVKREPEKVDRFGNVVGKKSARTGGVLESGGPQVSTPTKARPPAVPLASIISPQRKKEAATDAKKVLWDNAMIASLEAQGFARCESRQHLIYDYSDGRGNAPVRCLSPSGKAAVRGGEDDKSQGGGEGSAERRRKRAPQDDCGSRDPSPLHVKRTMPDERITAVSTSPRKVLSPRRDVPVNGSPKKKTAVMEMATAIEESSRSPTRNAWRQDTTGGSGGAEKDPAELSLAERKALFEKNGGGAVLPKAPFAMPVPRNALGGAAAVGRSQPMPTRGPHHTQLPGKAAEPVVQVTKSGLSSRVALFERQHPGGDVEEEDERGRRAAAEPRDPVREEIAERQREMEVLRNRHKNRMQEAEAKRVTEVRKMTETKAAVSPPKRGADGTPRSPVPAPPPPPAAAPTPPPPPPPMPSKMLHDPVRDSEVLLSPRRSYPDVKRIRVSPPKPGRIYPSISDIETETESELPESDRNFSTSGGESSFEDDSSSVSSIGRRIVKFASTTDIIQNHSTLKRSNASSDTACSSDESKVLQEIDDFLDEALKEPSPKRSRDSSFDELVERTMVSYPSGSCRSTSFEYSSSDPRKSSDSSTDGSEESREIEPQTEEEERPQTVRSQETAGEGPTVQLVHTISLYRKQQQNNPALKPAAVVIKRDEHREPTRNRHCPSGSRQHVEEEEKLVAQKINDLTIEVSRQQTVMSQTSQALNLCCSTVEFSGSAEQMEGEKLLLIAALRRQAALHELQRLRVEKRLRPGGGSIHDEKGNLTIQQITLPVKMDAIHQAAREEKCQHVVCLVRCGSTVAATEMVPALPKNLTSDGRLRFDRSLSFDNLYGDFTATLEVYTLAARSKELLPHDVKYHIGQSASNKKDKLRLTPKKGSKNETKFVRSAVESPGGPQAVRSPAFAMAGFMVFSLRELSRTHFTLNKVPYGSVVEGSVDMKMSCDLSVDTEHRGFLTMFEDVSGFGAWHRRWCLLKGDSISYWKYPEDEEEKIALDTIDLTLCATKEVGLVARDVCARPNTFLLEIVRPSRPGDAESLVLKSTGNTTTIRHLLSADTKEDRLEWCDQINRTLALLRAWGKQPPRQQSKRRNL